MFDKDSLLDVGSWHSLPDSGGGTTDIIGSDYDDIIDGSAGVNDLWGGDGDDTIQGRGGGDIMDGGGQFFFGIPDRDTLDYSWSDSPVVVKFTTTNVSNAGTVVHGSGTDTFTEFEAFVGSPYRDVIDATNSWDRLEINGGGGRDTILDSFKSHTLHGGADGDIIVGGQGQDAMFGGDGDDTFEFTFRTDIDLVVSGEVIDGGAGFDTILVGGTAVNFALASISSIEEVDFNLGYYTTQTNRAPFIARQTSATDLGSGLSQTLHVVGDGLAIDILQFHMNAVTVLQLHRYTFENWTPGVDRVEVVGDERQNTIEGSQRDDFVSGNGGNDDLYGNVGNDSLNGGAGDDFIHGGAGSDSLDGGSGRDSAQGDAGNDNLIGNAGSDSLIGGLGFDRLTGGAGRDVMTGGTQRDIFDFNSIGETGKNFLTRDVIKDFMHFQGDDIDLSTIDAATGPGNQKFAFIGQGAFKGVKGQLHYRFEGPAKTIVEGDVNGDKKADFQIELTGHKVLTAGDFIL